MKIEITDGAASLDIKRCYLPIIVTSACPTCGAEISKHLDNDYLMYPKINTPFEMPMYHCIEREGRDEEHEWKVKVILRVTMEAAP